MVKFDGYSLICSRKFVPKILMFKPANGKLSWLSVGLLCGRSRVRTNTQGLKITEENMLPVQ